MGQEFSARALRIDEATALDKKMASPRDTTYEKFVVV